MDEQLRSVQGEEPGFDWFKLAQANAANDRVYRNGFQLHSLTLTGGKYPPNQVFNFLGVQPGTTTGNATATFTAGGLADAFIQVLDVKPPGTVSVPSLNNPAGLKLTVTPATGVFLGSFNAGTPAMKSNISGVLFRNAASNLQRGVGHFLRPQDTSRPAPSSPERS